MLTGIKIFHIRFVSLLLGVLFLFSCEEKIDLELNEPDQERIVVEGRITNELKHHWIRLTKTLSYFANEQAPALIPEEMYILEEGTGRRLNLSPHEYEDVNGIYITEEISGQIGETYTLVLKVGDDTYKASDYMDTISAIDSAGYKYEYSKYWEFGYYLLNISAYEPPPVGHNYMFNLYLNDTLYNEELAETPYVSDLLYNDIYLENIDVFYIPQEEIIDSSYHVRIEMLSISEDEYNYNNTFLQETYNNGSIFSGPPANVPSNLYSTNGGIDGVGYFGAASITSTEFILVKKHDDSTNDPDYEYDK